MQILTDSKGAEALVGNPVQRQRTKHIGVPYHYVCQLVDEGVVMFGLKRPRDPFIRLQSENSDSQWETVRLSSSVERLRLSSFAIQR